MSLDRCGYFCVKTAALLILWAATPAFGQQNDPAGKESKFHEGDGKANYCSSCHAESQAPDEAEFTPPRYLASAWFKAYDVSDMKSRAAKIRASAADADASSLVCLNCHDGSRATPVSGFVSRPAVGIPFAGGLLGDHPVNIPYDPLVNSGLAPVASVTAAGLPLFDQDGIPTVQCSSCHDPHNKSGLPKLLRITKNGGGLCLTRHS